MATCPYCRTKLDDGVCFCKNCGAPVEQSQKTVFEGELHKCPNCGKVLNSFTVNCPACGHEFRDARNSTSVREFAAKIEEIEKSRPAKPFGFKKLLENQSVVSDTDKKKISLIRNFVVPNTKEDLFEFMVLASSNINMLRYDNFDSISESEQAVSDAWEAKFEQVYEKAKLSLDNTSDFEKLQRIYEKKSDELKFHKKKRVYLSLGYRILFALLVMIICGIVFFLNHSKNRKIEVENSRLEVIVEEVYDALEDENYVLARAKAASLTFSGPDNVTADKASEKWDKTRTELFSTIDAAEKANSAKEKADKSSTSKTSSTDKITEAPAAFIDGYEKAEFAKYNSPASENGLGDSKIYFYCTLDKTGLISSFGSSTITGYVTDDAGNEWLILLHCLPLVSETAFDSYIGKDLILRGVYIGYSTVEDRPSVVLDEMIVVDTGERVVGMQKTLDMR